MIKWYHCFASDFRGFCSKIRWNLVWLPWKVEKKPFEPAGRYKLK